MTTSLTARARLDTGALLLTPEDAMAVPCTGDLDLALEPDLVPERVRDLVRALDAAGLLDKERPLGAVSFAPGQRFFEYMAFTGCAVQFGSAATATPALSITIEGPFDRPRLRYGSNSRAPRCPTCRQPLSSWQAQCFGSLGTGTDRDLVLSCSSCGSQAAAQDWSWGRHAGVGRIFIAISPVFPGEGRPLPALLSLLEHRACRPEASPPSPVAPWRYFYLQGEHSL